MGRCLSPLGSRDKEEIGTKQRGKDYSGNLCRSLSHRAVTFSSRWATPTRVQTTPTGHRAIAVVQLAYFIWIRTANLSASGSGTVRGRDISVWLMRSL